MRPIKIILTACGCPGASTLIRMLKNNGEREIEIIGTDMDDEAIGRFLVDKFYEVPAGDSDSYIPTILDIVEKEKPDIVFPESSNEVYPLAYAKEKFEDLGTKVLVSNWTAIHFCLNKYFMYERLKKKNTAIPFSKYYSVESFRQFLDVIHRLGYPDVPVVFKPHVGKGSRGVRIIHPKINRLNHLMKEKPISKFISFEEVETVFKHANPFPKLLVMEYLDEAKFGQRTADTLCMEGRELLTTVKTVEQARWGVIVRGELVKDDGLIQQTRKILEAIPLSYCVNLQFIGDKLIEINPRVSTFIYQKDLIAPYLAIKLALGEITEDEIIQYREKIDYGRRMVRYMEQLFHKNRSRVA